MKIGARELKILSAFKANPGCTPKELGFKSDGASVDLAEAGHLEEGHRHIVSINVFATGPLDEARTRKERIFRITTKGNNYLNVRGKSE